MPSKRSAQLERTRRALLDAAHTRFCRDGYAAVPLSTVVADADVTKGALYHHFPDGKSALFEAVLEQTQARVAAAVAEAAERHEEPWAQFLAGCEAFLTASTDPEAQRIMLLDGPVVLGWDRWREIDRRHSFRHLLDALEHLMATGVIERQPVDPLAHLLTGAMNEAALWIAQDPTQARTREATGALHRLLTPLRTGDHR